jgi:two-component system, sensor histidine kinase
VLDVETREPDILVVDDQSDNLLAFAVALGDLAPRVMTASSGEEALAKLLEREFAVIVLDIKLAGMDGFETAQLIRARKKTRRIPIIFVTAFDQDAADLRRGYELGAVDFLFKPVVPEILRAKVGVFAELRDRNRQLIEQEKRLRESEAAHRIAEERARWEEEALRKRNEELAEQDRRKDEFIAILAHEIRNPLTPLVTGLELLNNRKLDEEQMASVRLAMQRQISHLVRLVDDLLDVARMSRGRINLVPKPIDLGAVVDHAIETCLPTLSEFQHELIVERSALPVIVLGDEVRLAQVVSNLLTNAARYTAPRGRISIRFGIEDGKALLSVRDNGRGLEPEQLGRIFDMSGLERRGGAGLGLGLMLVKTLVEHHGGHVLAKSEGRGKGSAFEIRLPLSDRSPESTTFDGHSQQESWKHRRIVLVEDEADVRSTVRLLLESWGHQVFVAENGESGVDLVLAHQPDAAILDLSLPGLDGCAAARLIRQNLRDRRPQLIAMSGLAAPADRLRTEESGFDHHLSKPAEPATLRQILENGDRGP